jgi:agmatine deiminase
MQDIAPNTLRRHLLAYPLAAAALAVMRAHGAGPGSVSDAATSASAGIGPPDGSPARQGWSMPSEHAPHTRCWMAWPARTEVWAEQLAAVRHDIMRLAQAIARFEPVSMLVQPGQESEARKMCGSDIEIVPMPVDDMWLRDSGPIFLSDGKGKIAGSVFNFNGWGKKQIHSRDGAVAAALLAHLHLPAFHAPIVTEGGAVETDGEGTLLVCEPSIDNQNRNPGVSRDQLTAYLRGWLGVDLVLWLPNSKPDYWTDGHIDGVARFVQPGVVLVDQGLPEAVKFLRESSDARNRRLQVIEVPRPDEPHRGQPNFCDCYLNFYTPNGAVITPSFGQIKSDHRARNLIAAAFPDRQITPIRLDAIASGGGLMHCVTQQEPAA